MIKRKDIYVKQLEWIKQDEKIPDRQEYIADSPLGDLKIFNYKGGKFNLSFLGWVVANYETFENAKAGAQKRIRNVVLSLIDFEA